MLSLQSQLCTREHSFRTWKKKKVSVFVIGAGFIFYASTHPMRLQHPCLCKLQWMWSVQGPRRGPNPLIQRNIAESLRQTGRQWNRDRQHENGGQERETRGNQRVKGDQKKKKKSLRPRREQPKGEMQIILQPKFTFWKNVNPLIISANVQDEVQTIYFFFFFIYLKQMLWIFIVIFCLSYLLYKICRKKTKLNSSNQTKWQRIV